MTRRVVSRNGLSRTLSFQPRGCRGALPEEVLVYSTKYRLLGMEPVELLDNRDRHQGYN